jgi:hypothetical protein
MSFTVVLLLVAKAMYIGGVYIFGLQVVTFFHYYSYFKPHRNLLLYSVLHLVEMVGCISK